MVAPGAELNVVLISTRYVRAAKDDPAVAPARGAPGAGARIRFYQRLAGELISDALLRPEA